MKHLTNAQIQNLLEDPIEKDDWLIHLEQCQACKDSYELFREIDQSMSTLEYERPSLRFAKNIFDFINAKQKLERKERQWTRIIQFFLFASMFLFLFLAYYFIIQSQIELNMDQTSLSLYFDWGFVFLISTLSLWILYGIDQWYAGQQKSLRKI